MPQPSRSCPRNLLWKQTMLASPNQPVRQVLLCPHQRTHLHPLRIMPPYIRVWTQFCWEGPRLTREFRSSPNSQLFYKRKKNQVCNDRSHGPVYIFSLWIIIGKGKMKSTVNLPQWYRSWRLHLRSAIYSGVVSLFFGSAKTLLSDSGAILSRRIRPNTRSFLVLIVFVDIRNARTVLTLILSTKCSYVFGTEY